MKAKFNLLCAAIAAGSLAITGCTDDKYNLDDVDMTMALGSDSLQLPVNNSVKDILLDDILDIDDSESVTIDANGNYHFEQSSTIDDVNSIKVDKIMLAKSGAPIENPVELDGVTPFPAITPEGYETNYPGSPVNDEIETFKYDSDPQESVDDLDEATLAGDMDLDVYFSSKLRQVVETIDQMYIEIPPFMNFEIKSMSPNASVDPTNDHRINFINQSTDAHAQISIQVTSLDLSADKNTDATNCIKFDKTSKKVSLNGKVKIYANISKIKKRTIADDGYAKAAIRSTLTISDIEVTSAKGKFNPDITVNNSTVTLDDLPDFLTDEEVVVDLYNPQIIFNATSNLPLPGFATVKLVAKKNDGTTTATVNIPEFKIDGADVNGGTNKICIARRDQDIPSDITQPAIIVPELSTIIEKVPDYIEVQITARADNSQSYQINMGSDYSLTNLDYSILAPLSFGKKAKIVYSDYEDGWSEDMPEDMDFEKGAYIKITANMESTVPTYLKMTVKAVDVNHQTIDNVTVSGKKDKNDADIKIIKASGNGNPVVTPIEIYLKEKEGVKGALKQVDGIHFTLEATSSDENGANPIEGKPLNANQNKLTAKDIKVTIHGRVIADFN